jgi:AcrR family transcriptional regulator
MTTHYTHPPQANTETSLTAARARSTRQLLIETAERLFAQNGVEAVTITEIQDASGQRNASAINYHFGGRDGLIRGIVDFRAEAVNRRRMELLDDLERQGRSRDVTGLVDAMVRPLAEQVEAGNHYIGFLARVTNAPPSSRPAPLSRDPANASLLRAGRLLRDALPRLPRPVLKTRLALASDLAIHALAVHNASLTDAQATPPTLERLITDLVDALAGFVSAPTRQPTRAASEPLDS